MGGPAAAFADDAPRALAAWTERSPLFPGSITRAVFATIDVDACELASGPVVAVAAGVRPRAVSATAMAGGGWLVAVAYESSTGPHVVDVLRVAADGGVLGRTTLATGGTTLWVGLVGPPNKPVALWVADAYVGGTSLSAMPFVDGAPALVEPVQIDLPDDPTDASARADASHVVVATRGGAAPRVLVLDASSLAVQFFDAAPFGLQVTDVAAGPPRLFGVRDDVVVQTTLVVDAEIDGGVAAEAPVYAPDGGFFGGWVGVDGPRVRVAYTLLVGDGATTRVADVDGGFDVDAVFIADSQTNPVAARAGGRTLVAWNTGARGGPPDGIEHVLLDDDAGAPAAALAMRSFDYVMYPAPMMAAAAEGVFVVAWAEYHPSCFCPRLFVQRVDAAGALLAPSPIAVTGVGEQVPIFDGFSLATLADGTVAIVYARFGASMFVRRLDAPSGAFVGATVVVDETGGGTPVIAAAGDGARLFWHDGTGALRTTRFDPPFTSVGASSVVEVGRDALAACGQDDGHVLALTGLVGSPTTTRLRRFTPDGGLVLDSVEGAVGMACTDPPLLLYDDDGRLRVASVLDGGVVPSTEVVRRGDWGAAVATDPHAYQLVAAVEAYGTARVRMGRLDFDVDDDGVHDPYAATVDAGAGDAGAQDAGDMDDATDAGPVADAGAAVDAGTIVDAGGRGDDGGATNERGRQVGGPRPSCACGAASALDAALGATLAVLLLLVRRRAGGRRDDATRR